jgi:hypothetical protein
MEQIIIIERRVPLYKLILHKNLLKQLHSFSENVSKCNFNVYKPWWGKLSILKHDCDDHVEDVTGVRLLDVVDAKPTDTVVLTEEQYRDYKLTAEQ